MGFKAFSSFKFQDLGKEDDAENMMLKSYTSSFNSSEDPSNLSFMSPP